MKSLDFLIVFPPTAYTPHLERNRTATNENRAKIQYDVPNGAVQVASAITSLGKSAEVIELDSAGSFGKKYLDYLGEVVESTSPKHLGISCMFNIQIPTTNEIIKFLQDRFKGIPLYVGGNAATYYPEKIRNGTKIFQKTGISSLVKDLFGVGDFDDLMFQTDWKLLRLNRPIDEYQFFPIYGRGCTFNCGFCSSPDFWGGQYYKPKANFRRELEALYGMGVREVCIGDETLHFNKLNLANGTHMFQELPGMRFIAESRADVIESTSEEVLESCRNLGLEELLIGAESGSKRVLELMNKRITTEEILSSARKLKRNRFVVDTLWIIGYPGSRVENDIETLSFIEKMYMEGIQDRAYPHIYRPFRGTTSSQSPEIRVTEPNFSLWNFTGDEVRAIHDLVLPDGKIVYSGAQMEEVYHAINKLRKKYEVQ